MLVSSKTLCHNSVIIPVAQSTHFLYSALTRVQMPKHHKTHYTVLHPHPPVYRIVCATQALFPITAFTTTTFTSVIQSHSCYLCDLIDQTETETLLIFLFALFVDPVYTSFPDMLICASTLKVYGCLFVSSAVFSQC